jgi:hypothetical protein
MPRPARKAELDEGPSAARRFSDTVRQILGVPKAELDKREAAYKRQRARKKRPGVKPKPSTR